MSDQPDLVDVTGLDRGDAGATERVARAIAGPCAEWGVFHAVGHGIPPGELARFADAMSRLFELPAAAKEEVRRTRDNAWGWYDAELTKNRRDWKEVFDYGPERTADASAPPHSDGTNRWPDAMPDLRDALLAHFQRCEQISRGLLRALCASLGLAPDRLDTAFADHTSFQRLNRYLPCPDPAPPAASLLPDRGQLAVHHHTDAGALTVLWQDQHAGLQVQRGEQLVLVEPVPGALTVNLGDMLQVWSNDRYRSPVHRVIASSDHTRYSAPFFWNPSYSTVCTPLPELTRGERAHYRPVSWARFRDQRSAGDYADYGAEIQIADFRIG
ncbi:MAG TPA: 2OG-Fe(II) oxygenase family protein [Myxococcota bacterium]|nr:2OG-Fe(II) oxygenase family protein [Myxococcota bacterium]